jgi:hypothetical protein
MTKLLKIAALAVPACATLALAQPAFAAGGSAGASTAAVTAATSASGLAKAAQAKRICINVVPDTGSRMARRMCKTKAEWADEGVDLNAKK